MRKTKILGPTARLDRRLDLYENNRTAQQAEGLAGAPNAGYLTGSAPGRRALR